MMYWTGQKKIKPLTIALACASVLALPASAENQITGDWLDEKGKTRINIYECGAYLCSRITWMKHPRKDIHNQNPALRSRNLVGAEIAKNIEPRENSKWVGDVYNSERGKTYPTIASFSNGALTIKGCLTNARLLCKTVKFSRFK